MFEMTLHTFTLIRYMAQQALVCWTVRCFNVDRCEWPYDKRSHNSSIAPGPTGPRCGTLVTQGGLEYQSCSAAVGGIDACEVDQACMRASQSSQLPVIVDLQGLLSYGLKGSILAALGRQGMHASGAHPLPWVSCSRHAALPNVSVLGKARGYLEGVVIPGMGCESRVQTGSLLCSGKRCPPLLCPEPPLTQQLTSLLLPRLPLLPEPLLPVVQLPAMQDEDASAASHQAYMLATSAHISLENLCNGW